MRNNESFSDFNHEGNPTASGENPWQKMANEMPPFSEQANTGTPAENEKLAPEADDFYEFDGVEYRNINKIDISSDEGKFDWLQSLTENSITRNETELENLLSSGYDESDEEVLDARHKLDRANRQNRILLNKIDPSGDGGMLGALRREYLSTQNRLDQIYKSQTATENSKQQAYEDFVTVSDLLNVMESEMASRDPAYFGQKEIETKLDRKVENADMNARMTMVDGYFGEDGHVHMGVNGEKLPSSITEDAESDAQEARQDLDTFNKLMTEYSSSVSSQVMRAIKKADFLPIIEKFIAERTIEIDRLIAESKTLAKESTAYVENASRRRALARERSSAKRLASEYFAS